MKYRKNTILTLFLALALGLPALAPAAESDEPYPLEYWALRSVISSVRVSPDGKYLALMKIARRDANPVIEVYDASDLGKKPFILNADPMEITLFRWVGDQDMIVQ
ncbi:MAG: hypothetical protein GWN87_21695, partial [Desulfuromonadales bacterium]|nr:hypothetical protein [Desulfuromonadales bacterium]